MVLRGRGSSEVVERQAEPPIDIGLNGVLFVAEGSYVLASLDGAEFGGRSMFLRAADKEDVVADLSAETRMHIGRKQRAGQIAEVLDAVHIGECTGDQNAGHGSDPTRMRMPNPQKSKSPSARSEGLGFGSCLARKMRALSHPVELHAVGPGHSRREQCACKNHFGSPANLRKLTHRGKNARSGRAVDTARSSDRRTHGDRGRRQTEEESHP